MQDLYETLGVSKDATRKDIKKAYHKLSMKHHPDKGGVSEQFHKILLAYEILMDNKKRTMYDNGENVFDMKDPMSFVKTRMTSLFFTIMNDSSLDYKFTNLFEIIIDQTKQARKEMHKGILRLKMAIGVNEEVQERISGNNSEFFIGIINGEITATKDKIVKLNEELEVADKVIDFIKDIEYKVDEKPERSPCFDAPNRSDMGPFANIRYTFRG